MPLRRGLIPGTFEHGQARILGELRIGRGQLAEVVDGSAVGMDDADVLAVRDRVRRNLESVIVKIRVILWSRLGNALRFSRPAYFQHRDQRVGRIGDGGAAALRDLGV